MGQTDRRTYITFTGYAVDATAAISVFSATCCVAMFTFWRQ